jgi:CO dehydrogenase/acetyl-CoA synthase gamma subunit (corrinoid Fe-S protein)
MGDMMYLLLVCVNKLESYAAVPFENYEADILILNSTEDSDCLPNITKLLEHG